MFTRFTTLIGAMLCISTISFAQNNVAINTSGAVADPSAMLDISSTNSGLLIPRVALVNVTNGVTPVNTPLTSVLVYNTNAAVTGGSGVGFYYWDGTQWTRLNNGTPSNDWTLLGNAGTNPATNFLGTTDNQSFVIRTNNTERVRVLNTGNVGIGTPTPIQNLDVNGRINVNNGIIQRGPTTINVSTDLGLYNQIAGNWIRIANNAAPIKFYIDQGGGNAVGTNSLVDFESANGGGVAISANTTGPTNGTPYTRAILDLQSTDKGFLTPRMTTVQRDAMGIVLTEGLLIYNIDNNCFEYWDTQATPIAGSNGFWNSLCDHCDNVIIITTNQTGYNLNTAVGGGRAEHYCVYIRAGVTLQALGNGGGSGAAGNSGFNASTMPSGASVTLYNYGNILAGGGNGGIGASESDDVCQANGNSGAGGAGGNAIQTINGVPITVFNYGIIRAGGGGGGGAGAGCCSAGGGGGGGAGTPAGAGGAGRCYNCTGGFICGCGGRTGCSAAGNIGTAIAPGTGGGGSGSAGSGCSGNSNGGTGATGGANGIAGNNQGTGCCDGAGCAGAVGGAAGVALQGSGSGSSMNNFGTVTGAVIP